MKKHLTMLFGLCVITNTNCFSNDWVKELYQFENWAGTVQTNYLRSVQNWKPDISTYGATNFLNNPYVSSDQNLRFGIYSFQLTNAINSVELQITETPSVLETHEMLMNFFDNCAAIQPFPTGASIGVNLGDYCYTGYPIGSTNSIIFVRNNIMINISSEDAKSTFEVASKIDQQLLSASFLPLEE